MDENKSKIGEFKVEEGLVPTTDGDYVKRWFITRDCLPEYQVNDFLSIKGLGKVSTQRSYAYSLVKFLRFLAKRNIEYKDCSLYYAKQYITSLVVGEMEDLKIENEKTRVTYSTISTDVVVLTEFFKYLKDEEIDILMTLGSKKKSNKKAFLYGQINEFDYTTLVDKNVMKLKPSKEYIKWYEDDQKEAILDNLKTLRDKAIFLLTLEGLRIDEALSIQLSEVDEVDMSVRPSRSKGKIDLEIGEDEDEIRTVYLPRSTFEVLNSYILTERMDAENESGEYTDNLFINLRKGSSQGKTVSYHNFSKVLKTAAGNAGLDKSRIRTHSGRSTKVNQLLEQQVLHPEDNLTDHMIKDMLGWKVMDSIEPYKNRANKVIAKAAADKVNKRRK